MSSYSTRGTALLLCLTVIASSEFVKADPVDMGPDSLSFQGFVTDEFGEPIDTSSVSILFKIYKDGVSVWEETHPSVAITNGVFDVLLGSFTPIDTMAFVGSMAIGITIGGDSEISPRTPLVASAFARALPGMYTYYRFDGSFTRSYNVIGGDPNNSIALGASGSTISGGGGSFNNNPVPNVISGDHATIGGGSANMASGNRTTISGGTDNTATNSYATVGGGWNNDATGQYASVMGGRDNVASGMHSSVLGGSGSTASQTNAAVVNGNLNQASGAGAFVGSGSANLASGSSSVVPGGVSNAARGTASFAAGWGAKANHDHTFVWNSSAGATGDTVASSTTDEFIARANNGFTFYTNSALSAGVTIGPGGGAWAPVSDVNAKTNFGQTDPSDVLERLVSIPVQTWRYKGQDESITHMGPTAQDFYAAFGLGYDDKHIVTVDADGVSFAAIQGLYRLIKEQQVEIERLRALVDGD